MPFGLTNAPMTFQRLIDSLFGPEFQPNVFGYLDDIIIATETFEEHKYWVELVLKRLVEARMKVNKEKCEVCCSRVAYLGYLLDKEGPRPNPEKVAPVLEYPVPRNKAIAEVSGDGELVCEIHKERIFHKGPVGETAAQI